MEWLLTTFEKSPLFLILLYNLCSRLPLDYVLQHYKSEVIQKDVILTGIDSATNLLCSSMISHNNQVVS